jgi:transposase
MLRKERAMAYREVNQMQVAEVLRRHAAGESQRAIARATGLSRNTVEKYLRLAGTQEPAAAGARTDPATALVLARSGRPGPVAGQRAPRLAELAPYRERIRAWLEHERLQLTRVQELLARAGCPVKYTTLRRFVRQAGLGRRAATTVRLPATAPGEVAEFDFGRLGPLVDPVTGRRRTVWALVVVLPFSRHSFVWPLHQQTLEAVIDGLEVAWGFFGGLPRRVILDNFPAAVAGNDPLAPRPTRGFLEYSQARGFLLDPARVCHPKDKPHVERGIQYVRERFWKGGSFVDLADARAQAAAWCRQVAGQRVHGTTRQLPLVVFEDQEQAHLLPPPERPYDVPRWSQVTVHPDHHIAFVQALYSVPSTTCPPGTKLEVRGDRELVRIYRRGELVKVHPRLPRGGRHTDPDDYPRELTAYSTRSPDRLIQRAGALGEQIGAFAQQLLSGELPWARLRQGQKLLRLADRYGTERVEAACTRALAFELLDVRRVERIVLHALEREGLPAPPPDQRLCPLPGARFARPGSAFDHRQRRGAEERP